MRLPRWLWPRKPVELRPQPKTHRIRFDGVNAGILTVKTGGQNITVCVFRRYHDWDVGDFVIFERRSGETTRYRIDEIDTPHDPGDQHFLRCSFAPRPPSS